MKKRIFGLVLIMTMFIPFTPVIANSPLGGTCGKNLRWVIDNDKSILTISGTGDMTDYNYDNSFAPWYYMRMEVKTVIFDGEISHIGNRAFAHCSWLTAINIPDSVTSIGDNAFLNCSALEDIEIPDSVTYIGAGAFYNTAYYNDKNNWSDGILYLGNILLQADKDIVSGDLTIRTGSRMIAAGMFYGCTSLTGIKIPDSVTEIGNYALSGCTSLTKVELPESLEYLGDQVFFECTALTEVNLPSNLLHIGDKLFWNCKSLKSIDIPHGITYISESMFQYCRSLESITLPQGVLSIGKDAFYCCTSLKNISIPDSLNYIGENAFNRCSSLINISIPDGVATLYYGTFLGCSSLEEAILPKDLTSLGSCVFCYCYALKSITIPQGIKTIGSEAFEYCYSLKSIVLPVQTTAINKNAFIQCNALRDVYYEGSREGMSGISIANGNTCFENAVFHYNAIGSSEPCISDIQQAEDKSLIISVSNVEYDSSLITIFRSDDNILNAYEIQLSAGDTLKTVNIPNDAKFAKVIIWDSLNGMRPLLAEPIELEIK